MANYRRLISYIYAYEGEVKGKNIGFAKLESRGGQCKLSVNVKKVYVGGSDLGVYLLAPGKEIHLGGIFIRGGAGEFRSTVAVENAADSGISMDTCYGLSIHEPNDSWRVYTTIWEDAVAHAAELELADVTSKNRRGSTDEEEIHKKAEEIAAEMERETAGIPDSKITQQNLKAAAASKTQAEAPRGIEAGNAGRARDSGRSAEAECPDAAAAGETDSQPENAGVAVAEAVAVAAGAGDDSAPENAVAEKEADAVEAAEAPGNAGHTDAGDDSCQAGAGGDVRQVSAGGDVRQVSAGGDVRQAGAGDVRQAGAEDIRQTGTAGVDVAAVAAEDAEAAAGPAKPWTVQQDSIRRQLLSQSRQMRQQPGARSTMESNESMTTPASWHAGRVMQPSSATNPRQTPPYERAGEAQTGSNPQTPPQPGTMQPQPVAQNGRQNCGENRGLQDGRPITEPAVLSEPGMNHPAGRPMAPRRNSGGQQDSGQMPQTQPETGAGAIPPPQPNNVQPRNAHAGLHTPAGRPMQPGRSGMPGSAARQSRFGHMPSQPGQPSMQPGQPPMQPSQPPMQPGQPPMQPGQPPMQPSQPSMQPGQPSMQPGQPPMQPGQPPMQPGQQPMQPSQPSMQPGQPPMQPGQPPMQPGQPPMQPGQPSMQPSQPPMQPGQPPMQPSRQPMQPSQPSMQPGQPPMQPGRQPMPPTQPPVQPTQPTHPPMQPGRHPMPSGRRPMQPGRSPAQPATRFQPASNPAPATVPVPTPESRLPELTQEKEPVIISDQNDFILGDPDELERLEQEERSNVQPQQQWDRFRKRYPKIQAFDCNGGCEILTIKPQDIGLLPRETWSYGNNSFLLHGYYNYRYLILAKVENASSGGSRYLLGVPGNYYSNEKYMASMFGFPHFVLAKKQPTQNGRFGYWYTDIKLDNMN